ncbi:MAG: TMEM175 family protein [Candidatus Acidiferrales bacterium]
MIEKQFGAESSFRWRGNEITRFEGLSDAVFAFAITLLIVSLEVPKTFTELVTGLRGFAAFAVCFLLLMTVWFQQYTFFRRYGLQDTLTLTLNSVLLFVILFYIYPLKFLFTLLFNIWMGIPPEVHLADGTVRAVIEQSQLPSLMIIYSAGYLAVSLVFTMLFWHANRLRIELDLNPLERLGTRWSIVNSLVGVAAGVSSILIATLGGIGHAGAAGWIYPVILGPGFTITGTWQGRQRHRYSEKKAAA